MTIGEKIRQLRTENDLTRRELTYFMDVYGRGTVLNWEHDKHLPELKNVFKLCEVFRVSLEEFFKGVSYK